MRDIVFKEPGQHRFGFALLPFCHGIAVNPLKHKAAQVFQGFLNLGCQADSAGFPGGADNIGNQRVNPAAVGIAQKLCDLPGQIFIGQDSRPDGIVDVVIDVGNLIAAADNLSFQRFRPGFSRVSYDAHADFIAQVQAHAVLFQHVHHPQTLLIMSEWRSHALGKRRFSGVTEGGMTQIMAHGDCFRQVFIQAQRPGDGARDAGDFKGMGHAGAVMIALRLQKHLSLVHQTAESLAVDNAVNIPLIAGTHVLLPGLFVPGAAPAFVRKGSQRVQPLVLQMLQFFFYRHSNTPQCN